MSPEEVAALRVLEEELLKPEVRRSADHVGRLLAHDFIEIGSSGTIFDRRQAIEGLRQTLRHAGCRRTSCW